VTWVDRLKREVLTAFTDQDATNVKNRVGGMSARYCVPRTEMLRGILSHHRGETPCNYLALTTSTLLILDGFAIASHILHAIISDTRTTT
jgi:hypothetical protein